MNSKILRLLLVFCCFGIASYSMGETTITVSGTVVIPPCEIVNINGTLDPIAVNFGDMTIKEIDGSNYTQTIPWTLKCHESADMNKYYKLRITGPVSDFDNAAIVTSVKDVGVKFMFGQQGTSVPLAIGSDSTEFTRSALLSAVPVKKAGVEVESGILTASASLLLIIP